MKKLQIVIVLLIFSRVFVTHAGGIPPSPPGSGSGISSVVEDTTPQAGGDFDLNGKNLTDATGRNDDDCTGDQGKGWWDSTDNQWEFCNDDSGVPTAIGSAETVTVNDDESTNDSHEVVFTTDNSTLESDGNFTYNPSSGVLTVSGGTDVPGTAYGGQVVYLREDTDNGANYVGIGSPASNGNDLILLLPTSDPTATARKLIGAIPSSVTGSDNVARDSSQLSWGDDTESIGVACSDETTDLTTGTAKTTIRMPFAMTVTEVRANVNTAPVGSTITVDINEGGTTILSTKLTIDASEETSTTAAAPAVISDSALADDAEITIDIDQIGSSTAGKGLKVWIIGTKS